ncbi:MAG: hypothetical protein J7M19_04345 [Planctomycetes bacterium]|nr:hypothetical protein [Planctomycetota bacterium]
MKDALKKSLLASLGAIDFSIEKAREAVDKLVERGEMTSDQGRKLIDELVERGKKDSSDLVDKVDETLHKAFEKITLVTKPKWDELESRLKSLEERVAAMEQKSGESD